jgi:hypothetical protein
MDAHLSDELPLEYLAALGAVTLNFAALETTLDFTVGAIFSGLDRMGEKEIPRSLDNKLGFLRKALKHPALGPVREAGNKVLDDVHNIKEERHDAIHGALIGSGMDTIRVRYTPQKHITQIQPAPTGPELERLALRVRALSERCLGVAIATFNIISPKQRMDDPFG